MIVQFVVAVLLSLAVAPAIQAQAGWTDIAGKVRRLWSIASVHESAFRDACEGLRVRGKAYARWQAEMPTMWSEIDLDEFPIWSVSEIKKIEIQMCDIADQYSEDLLPAGEEKWLKQWRNDLGSDPIGAKAALESMLSDYKTINKEYCTSELTWAGNKALYPSNRHRPSLGVDLLLRKSAAIVQQSIDRFCRLWVDG